MWSIRALDLGTLYLTNAMLDFAAVASVHAGEMNALPAMAWLLSEETGSRHVMIDAGPSEYNELAQKYHRRFKRTEAQSLENQLGQYGLTPADITDLFLTHLHWDHAWGAVKMPHARIYVQKKEMQYAITPPRSFASGYDLHIHEIPPFFASFYHQMVFLDGDQTVLDGINVITLPGHTPGSQGIVVDSTQGHCIFTGDLLYGMDNWKKRMPTGVFDSIADYEQSLHKLEGYPDAVIVPGHDPAMLTFFQEERP